MLIKNLTAHLDVLHDGRPLPAYDTAEITEKDLELPHYQVRIAEGRAAVAPAEPSEAKQGKTPTKAPRRKAPKSANEEKS